MKSLVCGIGVLMAVAASAESFESGKTYVWRFAHMANAGAGEIAVGEGYKFTFGMRPANSRWEWSECAADGKGWRRLETGNKQARRQIDRQFWWPDELTDPVEALNARAKALDESDEVILSLVCEGEQVYVCQQGASTGAFTVDPVRFYGVAFSLKGSAAKFLKSQEIRKTRKRAKGVFCRPVDLSAQFNAVGVSGARTAADASRADRAIEVGGVPFVLGASVSRTAADNVDVGESWFFQHTLDSWEWVSGRRWPESWRPIPGRLTFGVPNRPYTALYVLAAGDVTRQDAIDTFTVQFFGGDSIGQPKNFVSPPVPSFTAAGGTTDSLPMPLENGSTGYVHLVKIPLDPTALTEFSDQKHLFFELTKGVRPWRNWPDPFFGSEHSAGLPSRVRIFAATLEESDVSVTFEPTQYANLFVEGERPGYDAAFENLSSEERNITASMTVTSHDGRETRTARANLALAAGGKQTHRFEVDLERFGHFDVKFEWSDGERSSCRFRTLSRIRARSHELRPLETRGMTFGFWPWFSRRDPGSDRPGAHRTPPTLRQIELGGRLGFESWGCGNQLTEAMGTNEAVRALAMKYGMRSYASNGLGWWDFECKADEQGVYSLTEKGRKACADCVAGTKVPAASPICDPRLEVIFAEPSGIGTEGPRPEMYGEKPVRDAGQEQRFREKKFMISQFLKALREREKTTHIRPHVLMPWGDPAFGIPYVESPEEEFGDIEGTAIDQPMFGRLPEAQLSQNCALLRMVMFNEAWQRRHPGKEPFNITGEGPFIAPQAPAFSTDEWYRAAKALRMMLILAANKVPRQWNCCEISDPADWWGEEQYGGSGLFGRLTDLNPHVTCSTTAMAVRHLRDMEFDGWDELGTRGVYSLRFRNYKTGELLRTMWTLRGTRTVKLSGALRVFDAMDNEVPLANGLVLSPMPVFVYGSDKQTAFSLGVPDHSDVKLAPVSVRLGAAKDLFAKRPGLFRSAGSEKEYLETFKIMYRKFPGEFDVRTTDEGLAIGLTRDDIAHDRGIMPLYKTFYCDIAFPGTPEKIAVNVKGCSDWGRIVYELEDAKGEKWISCGQKDSWNVDDQDARSYFIHDGWRLLSLGLPGNAPYDSARNLSSTWWGAFGGDTIVDYPLTLKKIYVERRPRTIYVNSLEPVSGLGDVVLGDVYLEYASESDRTDEAIRLSRLRLETKDVVRPDVYAALNEKGLLEPTEILKVEHPDIQDKDGKKGLFFFREVKGAKNYDLYLSLDPKGVGAVKVKTLKKSGERVNGLKGNRDIYAFLVWNDTEGKSSRPSPIFKYFLQDLFSNK